MTLTADERARLLRLAEADPVFGEVVRELLAENEALRAACESSLIWHNGDKWRNGDSTAIDSAPRWGCRNE